MHIFTSAPSVFFSSTPRSKLRRTYAHGVTIYASKHAYQVTHMRPSLTASNVTRKLALPPFQNLHLQHSHFLTSTTHLQPSQHASLHPSHFSCRHSTQSSTIRPLLDPIYHSITCPQSHKLEPSTLSPSPNSNSLPSLNPSPSRSICLPCRGSL